jgi:cell division protein FtsB
MALACLLVGGTTYGITVLRGPHGIGGLAEKRREIEELEKQNEALNKEIVNKREHLTQIEQDPEALELEIEKNLKLVKPGSKVYIIQEGTKPDGQPPASDGSH